MTITQEPPTLEGSVHRPARTALEPLELLNLLQQYVLETAECLPVAPPDLAERQYELLELTDNLEIWAIHWPQGRGLELHDHGGSAGALWVVEGTLEEHFVEDQQSTARRSIAAGGGEAFRSSYIHDVVNVQAAPATSLHAYSPPMASMTFYRQESQGLVVDRTEYRADPSWAP
jgi:hypothetical protein